MSDKRYSSEKAFKYKVKKYYKEQDCFVIESSSGSLINLIVFYPHGNILGIQCKVKGNLLKYEEEELQELKYKYSIPILIASKDKKQIALRGI